MRNAAQRKLRFNLFVNGGLCGWRRWVVQFWDMIAQLRSRRVYQWTGDRVAVADMNLDVLRGGLTIWIWVEVYVSRLLEWWKGCWGLNPQEGKGAVLPSFDMSKGASQSDVVYLWVSSKGDSCRVFGFGYLVSSWWGWYRCSTIPKLQPPPEPVQCKLPRTDLA